LQWDIVKNKNKNVDDQTEASGARSNGYGFKKQNLKRG
jgi:hypothetical protein